MSERVSDERLKDIFPDGLIGFKAPPTIKEVELIITELLSLRRKFARQKRIYPDFARSHTEFNGEKGIWLFEQDEAADEKN